MNKPYPRGRPAQNSASSFLRTCKRVLVTPLKAGLMAATLTAGFSVLFSLLYASEVISFSPASIAVELLRLIEPALNLVETKIPILAWLMRFSVSHSSVFTLSLFAGILTLIITLMVEVIALFKRRE